MRQYLKGNNVAAKENHNGGYVSLLFLCIMGIFQVKL